MTVYPAPTQPQSSGWPRWLLIVVVIVVMMILLCCGLFALGGWRLFSGLMDETQAIEQVVKQFMDAGRRNDIDTAFNLFSRTAQREVSQRNFEQLFANRLLFREVESVALNSFNIRSDTEGTRAEVTGRLTYIDGDSQSFSALLEKENNQWRIFRIDFR